MTVKEISKTLDMLHNSIEYQRHVNGNDDKIRVRIGRELAAWINGYATHLIINHADDTVRKSIFGYPMEIDNENPMCLEVCVVESVPVYRESSHQVAAANDDQTATP